MGNYDWTGDEITNRRKKCEQIWRKCYKCNEMEDDGNWFQSQSTVFRRLSKQEQYFDFGVGGKWQREMSSSLKADGFNTDKKAGTPFVWSSVTKWKFNERWAVNSVSVQVMRQWMTTWRGQRILKERLKKKKKKKRRLRKFLSQGGRSMIQSAIKHCTSPAGCLVPVSAGNTN